MAENNTIKVDDYQPTPAEERLLQALANPNNVGASVSEICQLADVSRETYYKSFKKPEFTALHDSLCKDIVKQSLSPIVNAFVKEAKKGSFQHGKVLLEMGGLYTQKQEVKAEHSGNIETRIIVELPEELK